MLALAVHAATAQYDSLANLDTSAEALAAATVTVTIGAAPDFWYIPVSPYPPYTVCVGDKLSFKYKPSHNVWLMTDGPDYDYPFTSPGFFLGDATYGGGGVDGLPANITRWWSKRPARCTSRARRVRTAPTGRR